jgi:1,4-dihydroxy-2-naphthoyl-CoA synthase
VQVPNPERHEGVNAFNEKRAPDFTDFRAVGY